MADLSKVRMRAFVNETDIGNVKPAQAATVTVDAFPNRRFYGLVEQVEPEAVVQSSVTMFPVLVSLENPNRPDVRAWRIAKADEAAETGELTEVPLSV